jgi:hypothetical protein
MIPSDTLVAQRYYLFMDPILDDSESSLHDTYP